MSGGPEIFPGNREVNKRILGRLRKKSSIVIARSDFCDEAISNRMLKKSIHGFFNHDLAEMNSSKSYKLLDFFGLAIWQSVHGLHQQAVFQQPAKKTDKPRRVKEGAL